jgi:hypothetical protein
MWTGTSLAGRSILRLQFANWEEKRQSRASGQPRGLEIQLLFCFAAAPRTFFYHRYIHRTRSIECRLADQSGALPTGGPWAAAPLAPPQGRHCPIQRCLLPPVRKFLLPYDQRLTPLSFFSSYSLVALR